MYIAFLEHVIPVSAGIAEYVLEKARSGHDSPTNWGLHRIKHVHHNASIIHDHSPFCKRQIVSQKADFWSPEIQTWSKGPLTPKMLVCKRGCSYHLDIVLILLGLTFTESALKPALSLLLRCRQRSCFGCDLFRRERRIIQLDWHAGVVGWGRRDRTIAILHACMPFRRGIEVQH
jgi:hypothetical protein